MSEDNAATMKSVYEFRFFETDARESERLVRNTADLENDSRDFREEGIELLAQLGREDDECEVNLVGFQQI
jgi:hypothetical protein